MKARSRTNESRALETFESRTGRRLWRTRTARRLDRWNRFRRSVIEPLESRLLLVPRLELLVDTSSVSEGSGVAAIMATVRRLESPNLSVALTVALTSDDTDELSFPATITIPANATETTFAIDTINDAVIDHSAMVTLTSSAVGFENASQTITVTDDDTVGMKIIGGQWTGEVPVDTYLVSHSITVPAGGQLRISGGSTLRFSAGETLSVNGALEVSGSPGNEVHFESESPTPNSGEWQGIRIRSNGAQLPTTLEHVRVSSGQIGIDIGGSNAPVTIRHADISQNSQYGVFVNDNSGRNTQIADSRIHHNAQHGIFLHAGAILCNSAATDISILQNEIDNNGASGVHMNASASSGCILGATSASVAPLIDGNHIHRNFEGITGRANNSDNRPAYLTPEIHNNLIHDQIGTGIRMFQGSNGSNLQPRLIHNTVVDNGGDGIFHDANTDDGFLLFNNLIQGNLRGIVTDTGHSPLPDSVGFNNVFGNSGGNWIQYPADYGSSATINSNGTPADPYFNISVESEFDADGLRLSSDSPLVGAGSSATSALSVPTTDIDGDERLSPPDIGADEVRKLMVTFLPEGTGDSTSTALPNRFQARENTAPATIQAMVRRNDFDQSGSLPFTIRNPDPSSFALPASGIIPAGMSSAAFPVNLIDDGILETDLRTVIEVVAPDARSVGGRFHLMDDEAVPPKPIGDTEFSVHHNAVGDTDTSIDVAWLSPTRYVVVWRTASNLNTFGVIARLFDASNHPVGSDILIASLPSNYAEQIPLVKATANGDFVVAWTESNADTYSRRYNIDGVAQTPVIRVREPETQAKDVLRELAVHDDGSWAIAYRRHTDPPTSQINVYLRRYSSDGTALGSDEVIPVVARRHDLDFDRDGNLFIVWDQDSGSRGIYGKRFTVATNSWSESFQMTNAGSQRDNHPTLRFADNGHLILTFGRFSNSSDANSILYAVIMDSDGTPITDVFPVSDVTAHRYPEVASYRQPLASIAVEPDGNFLLVWANESEGIVGRSFFAHGLPRGDEFNLDTTSGIQKVPKLAVSPDNRLIQAVWSGAGPGDSDGSFSRQIEISNPSLTLRFPDEPIREDAGTGTLIVERSGLQTSSPLSVTLTSASPSQVSTPQLVTIPAGQASVSTFITIGNDDIAQGNRSIPITASAGPLVTMEQVEIEDDDIPTLYLSVDINSVTEGGPALVGRITRNSPFNTNLVVQLTTDDSSEIFVPPSITIPAGRAFSGFFITPLNDGQVDGTQSVTITASATGHASGDLPITVYDIPALTVTLPTAVTENAGSIDIRIDRNTDPSRELAVNLSSDLDVIAGLGVVTIPAGESFVLVSALVVDDEIVGDPRVATISASAPGLLAGTGSVQIADDEVAGIVLDQTNGSTFVSETGLIDHFFISLAAAPQSDVTLEFDLFGLPGVTVDPGSLVFSSTNWNEPRQVRLLPPTDFDVESGSMGNVDVVISELTTAFGFATLETISIDVAVIDHEENDFRITDGVNTVVFSDAVSGVTLLDLGLRPTGRMVTGAGSESILVDVMASTNDDFVLDVAAGDDVIRVTSLSVKHIDGSQGNDSVELAIPDLVLDWTRPDEMVLESIERVVLSGASVQSLTLNPPWVTQVVGDHGTLFLSVGREDAIHLGTGWVVETPELRVGQSVHRLRYNDARLDVLDHRPWSNPLTRHDVDRSGGVTSLDALRVINQLTRQGDSQLLPDPSEAAPFTDYFDVNADGSATALDALQVINFLGRLAQGESEQFIEAVPAFPINVAPARQDSNSRATTIEPYAISLSTVERGSPQNSSRTLRAETSRKNELTTISLPLTIESKTHASETQHSTLAIEAESLDDLMSRWPLRQSDINDSLS